jgi:hypothetical protein
MTIMADCTKMFDAKHFRPVEAENLTSLIRAAAFRRVGSSGKLVFLAVRGGGLSDFEWGVDLRTEVAKAANAHSELLALQTTPARIVSTCASTAGLVSSLQFGLPFI